MCYLFSHGWFKSLSDFQLPVGLFFGSVMSQGSRPSASADINVKSVNKAAAFRCRLTRTMAKVIIFLSWSAAERAEASDRKQQIWRQTLSEGFLTKCQSLFISSAALSSDEKSLCFLRTSRLYFPKLSGTTFICKKTTQLVGGKTLVWWHQLWTRNISQSLSRTNDRC